MPQQLGFMRNIDSLVVFDSSEDGLLYEFDRSAVTLRIFYPMRETGSAGTRAGIEFTANTTVIASTSLEVKAIGW